MPTLARFVLPALLLTSVTGCGEGTTPEPPGPPSAIRAVASPPASVPAGTLLDSLVARVVDAKGKGVPNVTVTWSPFGGSMAQPRQVVTDAAGNARTAWTPGTRAGSYEVAATAVTTAGPVSAVFRTAVMPGPARTVRISPAGLGLRVGEARQLTAESWDEYGNVVAGSSTVWSSMDESTASVTAAGSVVGRAPGFTEVTARAGSASATASVTVLSQPPASLAALRFDGSDDYVQVPDHVLLDAGTGDFTWEVWLKRSRTDVREDVLSKKDVFADSEHDVVLLIEQDGRANAFLREFPWRVPTVIVSSTSRVGTDWTHLAMTRSGGVVRLYVNGVLEGTGMASFDVSSSGPFRIGANRINNAGPDASPVFAFSGQVHEVRLWSVSRSNRDIAVGMLHCTPRGTAGLVGLYRFDQDTGTAARDVSGNGNDGVLRNGPTWVGGPRRCGAG